MDLLNAVNTVLPYLGEHVITRIEGAQHPTVDLILAAIERQRTTLLVDGWWFNELTLTLPVNTGSQIDVPTEVLTVYGIDCTVSIDGEKFYDLELGTRYFTKPIKVKLIRDIAFDRLPAQCALYLTYLAATEVYLADYGADATLTSLQVLAERNLISLRQENLRNRRYNSRTVALRNSTYHRITHR